MILKTSKFIRDVIEYKNSISWDEGWPNRKTENDFYKYLYIIKARPMSSGFCRKSLVLGAGLFVNIIV